MANRNKKSEPGILRQAIQYLASAFRRGPDGTELPQDGRSSVDSGDGIASGVMALGTVIPRIPHLFSILTLLERFSLCNPDFSQMVGNVVALGNTGHQITVDAPTDAAAETALARINESASRLYPNGAGIDGLINAYLRQSLVTGALSSEDVVDFTGKRVEKVVIVPVDEIRFRRIDGAYVPWQQPKNWFAARGSSPTVRKGVNPIGLVELNSNTYHYFSLETIENSPYARPPAIAAVDILEGPQKDAIENLSWIVRKLGILGLVIVNLTKPKSKPGETDEQYHSRAQKYLTAVREVLDGNFKKGLLVAFSDQKFDHANVASDARGAGDIFQVIEELAFSGMGSMAWMHGRNYTTTETFADVVYNILLSQMQNHQRLAKRRQEQTYRLDLMLAGIPVDGLSMEFNRAESRNELQRSEADQIKQQMALERCQRGITSPDECARELGYESAFDPELLSSLPKVSNVAGGLSAGFGAKRRLGVSATCRFDRASQRYRLLPSRIEIAADPIEADEVDNVFRLKKKAAA